ncbi:hypothetical protein B0H14DRAFT_3469332 [Mycena olivaceomarginata]|nr:hypothetical protein B0H14DRAFT_3469332 [Mycena olivaceomarginata]
MPTRRRVDSELSTPEDTQALADILNLSQQLTPRQVSASPASVDLDKEFDCNK